MAYWTTVRRKYNGWSLRKRLEGNTIELEKSWNVGEEPSQTVEHAQLVSFNFYHQDYKEKLQKHILVKISSLGMINHSTG